MHTEIDRRPTQTIVILAEHAEDGRWTLTTERHEDAWFISKLAEEDPRAVSRDSTGRYSIEHRSAARVPSIAARVITERNYEKLDFVVRY